MVYRWFTFFVSFISLLFIALFLLSCGRAPESSAHTCHDAIGCVIIPPDAPIEVGIMQSLTGDTATMGTEQYHAIELAIQQRGHQIHGHTVAVHVEDSQCSPPGGSNAVLNILSRPHMVAVLGPTCSSAAIAASPIVSDTGLVMLSASSTAPELTSIGNMPSSNRQNGFFRLIYNSSAIGEPPAVFAFDELQATKAATISDGNPFTKGLTNAFIQTFIQQGGEVVLDTIVNTGSTDIQPLLHAVADSGADVVFFALSQPERDTLVQQSRDRAGMEDVDFIAGLPLNDDFIEAVGSAAEGLYFVIPVPLEHEALSELAMHYEETFGEPPETLYYGYAYDAANVLLDVLETVAVQKDDGTMVIGRQALRDALATMSSVEGVTGSIQCTASGDCVRARFHVARVDDATHASLEEMHDNVVYTYP